MAIWVTGSLNLGGDENLNGVPANLTFFVTGFGWDNVNSNGELFGTIYAPTSGINLDSDVFGSVVGSTVTLNSGSAVHYDTGLACPSAPPTAIPPHNLPAPPGVVGCYVGTWNGWASAPCTAYTDLSFHAAQTSHWRRQGDGVRPHANRPMELRHDAWHHEPHIWAQIRASRDDVVSVNQSDPSTDGHTELDRTAERITLQPGVSRRRIVLGKRHKRSSEHEPLQSHERSAVGTTKRGRQRVGPVCRAVSRLRERELPAWLYGRDFSK